MRQSHFQKRMSQIPEQVAEVVAKVLEEYGKIDVLINNAGITQDALVNKMTDEQWDKVIAVSLPGFSM